MVEEALTAFCIGQEGTHVTRPMPAAIAAASLAGGRVLMKDQCAAAAVSAWSLVPPCWWTQHCEFMLS